MRIILILIAVLFLTGCTDSEAKTVDDLDPQLIIRTANPASLDVIIEACEQAKARLETEWQLK